METSPIGAERTRESTAEFREEIMGHQVLQRIISLCKIFGLTLREMGGHAIRVAQSGLHFFFFFFLEPHLQHMEVPRLGVKSELQVLAYATATAVLDPSRICNLCCSLQQCRILNPLIKARDQTCILTDTVSVS